MNNNLIIVFVRTPELGKVKTRLAKAIGDQGCINYLQTSTETHINGTA